MPTEFSSKANPAVTPLRLQPTGRADAHARFGENREHLSRLNGKTIAGAHDLRALCYPKIMDPKQLLAEALRLPDEQRAALAGELIQSLDSQANEDAEAAWSAEIRRRLERLDSGLAKTVPWAEARCRILAASRRDPRT